MNSLKKCILMSILAILFMPGYSQYKLNLGIFGGWNATFFQIQPQDPNLDNGVAFLANSLGLKAELRLGEGPFYLKGDFSYFSNILCFKTFEAPIPFSPIIHDIFLGRMALKRRIPIIGERLFLSPTLGFGFGLAPGNGSGFSSYYGTSKGQYSFSYRFPPIMQHRPCAYITGGLDLGIQFRNGMTFSFSVSYNQGIIKILDEDISYQFNNDPPTTLRFFTRGSHLPVQLGLSYPISRIWEGKIDIK